MSVSSNFFGTFNRDIEQKKRSMSVLCGRKLPNDPTLAQNIAEIADKKLEEYQTYVTQILQWQHNDSENLNEVPINNSKDTI